MGDQVAAFFDLDLTILSVNSASLWLRHMWRQGDLKVTDAARSLAWLARYKMAILDISDLARKGLRGLEGKQEEALRQEVLAWYHREVRMHIYAQARQRIESHRAQGHALILLTGSSPYISAPVCEELGLDEYLCTHLEVVEGKFTGMVVDPLCYGEGKVQWAQQAVARRGIDLSQSWFYSDSYTDLPMLQKVGHPVATNPDARLRRFAKKNGMQILDFVS